MLDNALKVIEAVRSMRLVRKGGRTSSELAQLDLAKAIDGLRAALESFDRETGTAAGSPVPAPKPEWATPPEPEGMAHPKLNLAPEYAEPMPQMSPEAIVEALEAGKKVPSPDFSPELPVPVLVRKPSRGISNTSTSNLDLGDDGAFFDGDESAADLLLAIDSINDKLAFAVTKVGWSPRLRALAEAARIAQNNMYIEVDNAQGWVRVPAHNWGTLSVAIAEAALDQDLTIALPKPRPRPAHEHEYDYAPKPRFD